MNATADQNNKTPNVQRTLVQKLRHRFAPRGRRHDPFLVLSLATFNSGDSWAEIFSPLKVRENVG